MCVGVFDKERGKLVYSTLLSICKKEMLHWAVNADSNSEKFDFEEPIGKTFEATLIYNFFFILPLLSRKGNLLVYPLAVSTEYNLRCNFS